MTPRWVDRLYAAAFGFFWLPCPVCGRMFGGHEVTIECEALVSDDGKTAQVVCPDPACSVEARARNLKRGFALRGAFAFDVKMPK